jgi:hypothetical protein
MKQKHNNIQYYTLIFHVQGGGRLTTLQEAKIHTSQRHQLRATA